MTIDDYLSLYINIFTNVGSALHFGLNVRFKL